MDIPVLHYLDVVIGFSLVMLLGTTVVTSTTQAIVRLLNLRAMNLKAGLEKLVADLDPALVAHAKVVAGDVIKHPLVAAPGVFWSRRCGVIQREELIRILLELASPPAPGRAGARQTPLNEAARTALAAAIGRDPQSTLRAIRTRAQELERDAPWLASHVRQTQAIIDNAAGEFVGKITDWFDETMDRLSQRFALRTQLISIVAAVLVATTLGLDSLSLLARLDGDEDLLRRTVASAQHDDTSLQAIASASQKVQDTSGPDREAAIAELAKIVDQHPASPATSLLTASNPVLRLDSKQGVIVDWSHVPGVLLTIVLLSLGAPFWFDVLKNGLRLRPLLAGKEEQERDERRLDQPAVAIATRPRRLDVSVTESTEPSADSDMRGPLTAGAEG